MKKTINGILCDTDNATLVTESHGGSGLAWYAETLYKTPGGDYFMICEGGPGSMHHVCVGPNQWSSGYEVRLMDETDVMKWHERVRRREDARKHNYWSWAYREQKKQ